MVMESDRIIFNNVFYMASSFTFFGERLSHQNLADKRCEPKIHSFLKVFFDYENKVLQLMSAGASLERFGEGFQEVF